VYKDFHEVELEAYEQQWEKGKHLISEKEGDKYQIKR